MTSDYKDIFHGTAWYYARYREGYPQEFFDLIRQKFDLSTDDRVLDLGCGTGQIAIPISSLVKEVIAMDPEPEMIEEGKKKGVNIIELRDPKALLKISEYLKKEGFKVRTPPDAKELDKIVPDIVKKYNEELENRKIMFKAKELVK